ncbi:hypothetical protein Tco_0851168 [Tanacetum coccineum]
MFGTIPTTIPDTTPVITLLTTQTDTIVIPTEIPIIAPTIPPSPDYTPASPDYSPASDTEFGPSEDPSSDHIPSLPAILPFLSSPDDTTHSDTLDTPPSPTHGIPFTKTTLSTQRPSTTSGALRRRVMVLALGQPIPHGRLYRYHLNGPVHMMTARKRVGLLPTHQTSSDSYADALSDSASSRSSSDHSLPASPSDLLPSPKRIRSHETTMDSEDCLEDRFEPYVPREVRLGVDFEDESYESSRSRGADLMMDDDVVRSDGIEIDSEIQVEIDECFAYADALRDIRIDARVVVEAVDREESETDMRGLVEVRVERVTHPVMPEDTPEPAKEGAVEGVQREQGCRIVGAESAVTILTKRVAELERDNRRLRGIASVESQRVDRLQRDMARMQRELR